MENDHAARDKKTAETAGRVIGYADEAAFYLLPCTGYTWGRTGHTPVLQEGDQYQHVSVISAITETGDLIYHVQDGSFTGEGVVTFLNALRATCASPLTLIWDGASIHRGDAVKTFLRTENQAAIQLERLPAYSPALNADEYVWAYVKEHLLKNVCCKTLQELRQRVIAAFERLKQQPVLIQRFFYHPDVSFY